MDTQVIELLGRNRLISELLRAGLEVALPQRDRGIDLIAYADLGAKVSSFIARPIQMKAASGETFSINAKYKKFPNLILAFVWYLEGSQDAVTYALTYDETISIGDKMGWTGNERCWLEKGDKGAYSISKSASKKLKDLLAPHRMTPKSWWEKITDQGSSK